MTPFAQQTDILEIEKTQVKKLGPYHVILHNDDLNSLDYVVFVIMDVFSYSIKQTVPLVLEAHEKGKSIVWTGSKELAELRRDQIIAHGPDPNGAEGVQALSASIEPA